jgi:hypothetical protein
MLQFVADENFNNDILRGIRRRNPEVDVVRVQDEGLSGQTTPRSWNGRPKTGVCC